ncbi:MAG: hypothetical protein COA90_09935 [Gammaproteobacteria bacterium]|nr:MAG: hypothetical protein COA90_09935 [Gammaproteobacteria bacterium]
MVYLQQLLKKKPFLVSGISGPLHLSHLRVHKFQMNKQQVLLAYSWLEDKIEIYLLYMGSHENFYQKMKGQRKADFKFISS